MQNNIHYTFTFTCYSAEYDLLDIEQIPFEAFPEGNHLEVAHIAAQQKLSEIMSRRPEVYTIEYQVMELKFSDTITRLG